MTNNGIKLTAILDALYQEKADEWRMTQVDDYVRLAYSDFERILMKNEISIDPRTIRLKWKLLTNVGIFAGSNKLTALVDLYQFRVRNPVAYDFSKAHIHTYIQKPDNAQEADQ